ncbi:MAG: sulfatase-like hydrolase/transferase [bacterium]
MKRTWIVAVLGLALAAAVVAGLALRKSRPVNLLLISVDTLRPDHLGCYGHIEASTPTIDALARRGVVFEDALASVPLTLPSHTSMLTGLSPLSHGVRDNSNFKLADDFVTLAEVLRANGYSTGAVVGAFILDSRYGLKQGFDTYDDNLTGGSQGSIFGYPERPADAVTRSALAWLEGAREPFFLFAHYYDPHAPYTPPGQFREAFRTQPYDGEIAFTDHEIGKLLGALRSSKRLDRTLVVLVSDHGEGLGEHGEATHGLLLYEATIKVAFIISPAAKSPFGRKATLGRRSGQTVRLTDLHPTVLEMLGLKQDGAVDGRSLVPLLEGRQLPPEVAYFESMSAYFAYRWSPLRGVTFNGWKYIFAPAEELYYLRDDPSESRNLAGENPGKAAEMKAALTDAAREEPQARASQTAVSPEEAQKLRALGYVSTSPTPVPELGDLTLADPKAMIGLIGKYLEPGDRALDDGDYEGAMRYFSDMVKADPGNPEAQLHYARVLLEKKDYAGATVAYQKVLAADPANSGAWFHLGNIAQATGDLDGALRHYQKSLDLIPESPEAMANLGSVLLTKGLTDSAMAVLYRAIEMGPRSTVALLNLGIAYAAMDLPDSALTYLRRTLAVNANDVKALNNCAAIFVNQGQLDSALAYFERVRAATPDDPKAFINLGGAYRQRGELDAAGAAYEAALRLDARNVIALYGLAGVRLSQGRREDAEILVRKVLEIDPTFEPARLAAERLGIM